MSTCRCACRQVVSTWIIGAVWSSIESGSRKTWLAGTCEIFGKAAVDVAADQRAVGAEIASAPCGNGSRCRQYSFRIDDDALAGPLVARVDDLAGHLVAQDAADSGTGIEPLKIL